MPKEKHKIERILISVKPWEGQLPLAATNASGMAKGLGAEIELMSCLSISQLVFAGLEPPERTASSDAEQARSEQEIHLERLAQALRETGATVGTRVSSDSPVYRAILDEAAGWKADLLVAGAHEPELLPTPFTDVDRDLMRLAPCPLLLAKNPALESYRTVLAAVDPLHLHAEPTGLDAAVLDAASTLSAAVGAELCVANVHPDPEDYEIVSSVEVQPGVYYGAENIPEVHRRAVDDLIAEAGISQAQVIMRAGDPAAAILELLSERSFDVVVLGTIKRSAIEEAFLGSTAEKVAAGAGSDVLLVKG
jgi:nucleotide-binding universal stress UspA family protein